MLQALPIAPGIVLDDTAAAARGRWIGADKVRFVRGLPQVIGGWEALGGGPLTGKCRGLLTWRDNNNALNHALGTHSKLYVISGGDLFDVTPAGLAAGLEDSTGGLGFGTGAYSVGSYSTPSSGDFNARTWSFAAFGQTLLANPSGETIYQWSNVGATPAAAVTNAPAEVRAISVPMNRRHVVAYGCNEETSGDFNPRCIRWSDFEDITDWTTSSSNNAGEYILEGSGAIIGVKETSFGAFIWTTNELWFQEFLGAPDQTYRFTRLGTNCGLISANGCVTFEGSAYWMSPDGGFWTCPAGGAPSRMQNEVEQDVRDNRANVQQAKVYAATVSQYREVWWFYPDERDGNENSRYVSLQLDERAWSAGQLARTAFLDSGAGPAPLAVDPDGNVYYHERGNSANGGAISWSLESGDALLAPDERFVMVQGVRPDVDDQQGLANLEIYMKPYPQGDETTYGPYAMTAGRDKIDLRASGRIARLKFYGETSPCRFRLGQIKVDVKTRGRR